MLPVGVRLVMLGRNIRIVVDLITPIALTQRLRFAIRPTSTL